MLLLVPVLLVGVHLGRASEESEQIAFFMKVISEQLSVGSTQTAEFRSRAQMWLSYELQLSKARSLAFATCFEVFTRADKLLTSLSDTPSDLRLAKLHRDLAEVSRRVEDELTVLTGLIKALFHVASKTYTSCSETLDSWSGISDLVEEKQYNWSKVAELADRCARDFHSIVVDFRNLLGPVSNQLALVRTNLRKLLWLVLLQAGEAQAGTDGRQHRNTAVALERLLVLTEAALKATRLIHE